jgi:hypothetical protein
MDVWLLKAKKIKLTVSTCDANDTDETESCANGAGTSSVCSALPMQQLPKNDDGHFPKYWAKDQWRDKLYIRVVNHEQRGAVMFHMQISRKTRANEDTTYKIGK